LTPHLLVLPPALTDHRDLGTARTSRPAMSWPWQRRSSPLKPATPSLQTTCRCLTCLLVWARRGPSPRSRARPRLPTGRRSRSWSVLPAWSAETDLDLADDEALGCAAAAWVIAAAVELKDWRYEARQAVMAGYSAVGFEAAKVVICPVPYRIAPIRIGDTPSSPASQNIGTPGSPWRVSLACHVKARPERQPPEATYERQYNLS
jgi:hypothetical protein